MNCCKKVHKEDDHGAKWLGAASGSVLWSEGVRHSLKNPVWVLVGSIFSL